MRTDGIEKEELSKLAQMIHEHKKKTYSVFLYDSIGTEIGASEDILRDKFQMKYQKQFDGLGVTPGVKIGEKQRVDILKDIKMEDRLAKLVKKPEELVQNKEEKKEEVVVQPKKEEKPLVPVLPDKYKKEESNLSSLEKAFGASET